jgi:hypothetical protein
MSHPEIRVLADYYFSTSKQSAGKTPDPMTMREIPDNVLQFPLNRRRDMRTCPHCGTHSDVWQIGRLLWGYCDQHEVRWVVAEYPAIASGGIDRTKLRRGLEFLSSFVEVSR